MRILILSAGLGERLRPLTLKRAKPAVDFLNIPMLGFPFYWLNTLGAKDVVFNTHYLPETIRHAAMRVVPPETHLHFSHEEKILGSGGGIWQARFDLMSDRDFAVANGDGVMVAPRRELIKDMLEYHRFHQALVTLLACPFPGVGEKIPGAWVNEKSEVVNFGKQARPGATRCLHYASILILSDQIWSLLPDGESNILYDVLEPQIAKGAKVMAYQADDLRWFETGNIADYLKATRTCLEFLRDDSAYGRALVGIFDSIGPTYRMRSDFKQMRLIADSAIIHPGAEIRGFSVIGPNCEIPDRAQLTDCVVLSGARLTPGTHYENEVLY